MSVALGSLFRNILEKSRQRDVEEDEDELVTLDMILGIGKIGR